MQISWLLTSFVKTYKFIWLRFFILKTDRHYQQIICQNCLGLSFSVKPNLMQNHWIFIRKTIFSIISLQIARLLFRNNHPCANFGYYKNMDRFANRIIQLQILAFDSRQQDPLGLSFWQNAVAFPMH